MQKKIEDLGITTHLKISPYQNKPTQEGLYRHYAAIADSIERKNHPLQRSGKNRKKHRGRNHNQACA
ncbi:MAG: dihydrodipicolinate synthase family protein [Candidatus Diapherotrites archaeon]|nr:dihydrodipicolinate synthase family protein [Candidatus Diapherotrites archaeon]